MSGCPGWESINPLCRAGQILGGTAKAVGSDVFGSIADYFAGVANSAVSWLWQQLDTATSIDLTAPDVQRDLVATGAIAGVIAFALFVVQVIASALRQDGGGLGRAVRGLGVSFIGAAFAVAATQALLAAVDALSNGVVQFALGTNVRGLGSRLVVASTLAHIGNPAGLLLISLVLIAAVVVVWVALMIRKMLIIVAAVFAPVAFSGSASDMTRSWVRRWIEFTVALVFSKLILVIIFMIGLSVLQGAGSDPAGGHGVTTSITDLVIGALTLLLAGFAPWIAIKMVHFAGDSFHAVHHQASTAAAGAQTVVAAPQKVSTIARPVSTFAARSVGGSSSAVAPTSQPKSRPPDPGPPGRSGPPNASTLAMTSAAGGRAASDPRRVRSIDRSGEPKQ